MSKQIASVSVIEFEGILGVVGLAGAEDPTWDVVAIIECSFFVIGVGGGGQPQALAAGFDAEQVTARRPVGLRRETDLARVVKPPTSHPESCGRNAQQQRQRRGDGEQATEHRRILSPKGGRLR